MQPTKPPTANPSEPQNRGRAILCVEDERFISELYVRALTKAGYTVTVEPDGKKALDLARTNKFDIILLDLMVPTMTGIDILRNLRGAGQKPIKSKIVITTNLEQREEIRADIEKQADAYLVKAEITPKELVLFLDTIK